MIKAFGILLGIIGFLLLITIHEGGHFFVSKLLGIRVNEFSVGMGPVIYSTEKNGTNYSFRAFPVGGYCALEGEFPEDATDEDIANFKDEDPKAFINQPWWKQSLVLIAGSFINFVAGFIILIIVYSVVAAGNYSFARILSVSWSVIADMIRELFAFICGLFDGSSSVNDVSGVVGIISIVAESASYGLINVFYLLAILSVNLSVMNMLPIPGLDGGRLLLVLIKAVLKDRYSDKAERFINGAGTVFLLLLIVLIMFKDIWVLIK